MTILGIGTSALTAFRRSIDTISNNIANVNTPGYSRQTTSLVAREPQFVGVGFVGRGVEVASIERVFNEFLTQQVRTASSSTARFDTLAAFAGRVDDLLADPAGGLSPALSAFYGAVQDFAADPASPSRDALFAETGNLVSRFRALDQRLNDIANESQQALGQTVAEINQLSSSIARLNRQIVEAGRFNSANDLLDQRDSLIRQLAEKVDVTVVPEAQGNVNIFIGNGQSLVVNTENFDLALQEDEFNPTTTEVVYVGLNGATSIEGLLTGGELGAVLEFQQTVLEPAQRDLGAAAVAFTTLINAQNAQGLNAQGELGADIFTVGAPRVSGSNLNAGTATASVTLEDVGQTENVEYRLLYDGVDYRLFELGNDTEVALTGSGTIADPFVADGLSIVMSGTPVAGDRYSIEPTIGAVGLLELVQRDGRAFAAAGPTRAEAAIGNLSNTSIDNGTVVDATNADLLSPALIAFTSDTSYTVDGGAPIAYTAGDPLVVNGVQYELDGTPVAGDQFQISRNTNAEGDNRNARLLGQTQSTEILRDGTISVSQSYSELVGRVGSQTGQAQSGALAQSIVLQSAENRLLAESGVNLDQEAAELIRYQQAYQAAAQVITVGSTLFDTLLAATRR